MRAIRCACASAIVAGVLLGLPARAGAQENVQVLRQEMEQLRKDFEQRMAALEARLTAAQGAAPAPAAPPAANPAAAPTPGAARAPAAPPAANRAAAPPPAQATAPVPAGAEGAGGPAGALPVYGASVGSSKVFNPDIAVIGDFLGAAGHNVVNPQPPL